LRMTSEEALEDSSLTWKTDSNPHTPSTEFAPFERKPLQDIVRQSDALSQASLLTRTLDAMPTLCMILNKERQVVFANRAFLRLLGLEDLSSVCGLRPGEALGCLHAFERHEGCGTTEFCRTCGAVKAILAGQQGTEDVQECRIIRGGDSDALDLRVWATPITVGSESYIMFTAADISDEKRRAVLERIFFHDIINTAGGILGCSELLADDSEKDFDKFVKTLQLLSARLIQELDAQRHLIAAESGELSVKPSTIETVALLEEVVAQHNGNGRGRFIKVSPASKNISFESDRVLLRRVIDNLLKNALEAARDGETITIGSGQAESGVEFWVHNPGTMERDVQLQMFQRSFSTKGAGRGIGTYSVRLLTQRYLKGTVSFTSSLEEGTIFRVTYPYEI
jgi:PAS domain-containing protein